MTPVPQDQWKAYATDIYCDFLLRSGLPPTRCMSPVEWRVMKSWIDTGVPLRIVLAALKDAGGHGKTLAYYERPVAERYAHWRAALGGHAA